MESITLNVEPKVWYFRVSRARKHRRRPPGETMYAWVARWQRRTRDTVTGEVHIAAVEVDYDFIRNEMHYRLRVPRLVNGQDYGLPAVLMTRAQAVEFEAIDGKYVSRADLWERFLA